MSKMVCIATNNGRGILDECLDRYDRFNPDWHICVGDTGSSDAEFREYARELCRARGHEFIQNEEPLYDFGIYSACYQRFRGEVGKFFFHHDSVWCKSPRALDAIDEKLEDFEFVPWVQFARDYCPFGWAEDRDFCLKYFGSDQYRLGVYGSNVAVRTSALDKMWPTLQHVRVTNKMEQCGMERGWAILAEQLGLSQSCLDGVIRTHHDWNDVLHSDGYEHFTKHARPAGPRL